MPCRPEASNPFWDPDLVEGYEAWYEGPGRRADRLEKALLQRLLECFDDEPWRSASPLTVSELRRLVAAVCGDLEPSVRWFTTLWPGLSSALRAPWGGFIGMAVNWEARSRKAQQR